MLTLLLQVCSFFYLATNTNNTLKGFFYHFFSIIYASLFFAVCFVVTFERLAETFQFMKWFLAGLLFKIKFQSLFNLHCWVVNIKIAGFSKLETRLSCFETQFVRVSRILPVLSRHAMLLKFCVGSKKKIKVLRSMNQVSRTWLRT